MAADFYASYLSGAASIILGNPLDLLKVRIQAASSSSHSHSSTNALVPTTARSLLAGLPAPVLTYGALNALLFTSYNRTLALLPSTGIQGQSSRHAAWTYFTAGTVAGAATFVVSAPTEYVKCRAQIAGQAQSLDGSPSHKRATTSWTIAKETVRVHGIRGLYVGGVVTALRDAIGYGFYFMSYELCRSAWEVHVSAGRAGGGNGSGSVLVGEQAGVLLCGGVAGVATWASVFPLDVVKTRVQTQSALDCGMRDRVVQPPQGQAHAECTPLLRGSNASSIPTIQRADALASEVRKGAWTIAKDAYAREGVAVFWRGLGVCCVRAFVVNAVQWAVYEWAMGRLK